MRNLTRIAALLLAAACAAPVLTGCQKEPDFTKESELPYGATMREDKTSFAVPMTYDRRFLDEEQVAAAAQLMAAIQNADADLYRETTFDFYADYQAGTVYRLDSVQDLMDSLHASVAANSGEDFTFNMVLINGIASRQTSSYLSDAFDILDQLRPDEKLSESIEDAWDLTVEWDLAYDGGKSYTVVDEQHIFLFRYDGRYVCMM